MNFSFHDHILHEILYKMLLNDPTFAKAGLLGVHMIRFLSKNFVSNLDLSLNIVLQIGHSFLLINHTRD